MSYALASIDLSSATTGTTGTVNWATIGQQATIGRYDASARATLAFLNESGCGLQISFNNGQQLYLPAGGWQPVSVAAECTSASYTVIYTLANPLVSTLLVTWYAPDEPVPAAPILGNSPIGGSITANTSTILQGTGQLDGVTTRDQTGLGFGPQLYPAVSGQNIYLDGTDNNGNPVKGLRIDSAGAGKFLSTLEVAAATTLDTTLGVTGITTLTGGLAQLTTYNTETLAGNGLVGVEEDTDNQNVTTTGSKTIATYAVPATSSGVATIRVSGYVIVNNGVSGNNITFNVNYKDQGGSSFSRSLPMFSGLAAVTVMNGSVSIANNHYEGYPLTITVQQSQSVTITYNDPTNTPNDHVTGVIERLS